ncbi:hypothetical protein D9611_001442 [Ephemerocybe angulata]|uniref:Uncharacterized protein n=1 Tax=Ephemerocybe angulata TaxID=980116 RepID=A0A8H5FMK8_9AGAR|nr:hypothetical protein D9611_001442 [Tulosesus angulatus]
MSARLARSAFQTARRSAAVPGAVRAAGRRSMATSSEGTVKKSDTPWLVGSALIFGPAFLYLVSPSGRKSVAHAQVHDDKHDFPTLNVASHDSHPAFPVSQNKVVMKDDEGTAADVTSSLALAEEANGPKDDVPEEKFQATKAAASAEPIEAPKVESSTTVPSKAAEPDHESIGKPKEERSATTQKPGTEGPEGQDAAREASVVHDQSPKEYADKN